MDEKRFVPRAELDDLEIKVARLLDILGSKATCKGCGADIWWVFTRNQRKMPVSKNLVAHFGECPKGGRFRKKGEARCR